MEELFKRHPEKLSLQERANRGLLPDKLSVSDIAELEHPNNQELRGAFIKILMDAKRRKKGNTKKLRATYHVNFGLTAKYRSEDPEPLQERVLQFQDEEDNQRILEEAKNKPPPVPPGPMDYMIQKEHYREWCLAENLPLPAWCFLIKKEPPL